VKFEECDAILQQYRFISLRQVDTCVDESILLVLPDFNLEAKW
jgi:hypothetical protein